MKLVAVSKTQPVDAILPLYEAGQRIFGENRVQELVSKQELLPKDIEWHLIGHLQTNKVKFIAPFVSLIHSVDSLKLLEEINRQALKNNRVIDCLLQVYISQDDTKFGLDEVELIQLLDTLQANPLSNIRICGLMGMASLTDNQQLIASEFHRLSALYQQVQRQYFKDISYFSELSMGMSSDYEIAIEQGSTMVRIGSLLFRK